jgi:hypothetical protein
MISGGLFLENTTSVSSVTDSAGNTYVVGTGVTIKAGWTLYTVYSLAATSLGSGGTITVNGTFAAGNYIGLCMCTATGIIGLDEVGTGAGGAAQQSISTGTLGSPYELIVGIETNDVGASYTESAGFTSLTGTGNGFTSPRIAFQIVNSTASVTYAPTTGGSNIGVNYMAFKGNAAYPAFFPFLGVA